MAEPDTTVGIGPVTNRTDGLISLHVGNSYVELSPLEAKRVAMDLASLALGGRVAGFNLADTSVLRDNRLMTRAPTAMELRCVQEFAACDCLNMTQLDSVYREFALKRVRAIIRAMTRPTEEMISAAQRANGWKFPLGPEMKVVIAAANDAASPLDDPSA